MTFLEQKIRDAHTAGRTALIPFVTAGFPALDTFWGIIEELDANGADVIEIGVPFSDPVADGPVVEDASRRALEQGVSLNWIMDGLKQRAGNFKAGIVLMGYLNPFLQYGWNASPPMPHKRASPAASCRICRLTKAPLSEPR